MKRFLALGAAVLFPLRAEAVTVTVDAGDTVNGGSVQQIVTQNVEGVTNNLTIYGTQNVMSGGVSNNSLIYTYGQQTVNAGGTASGSTVMQQGVMNVSGAANNTNIRAYGDMTVRSGGTTKLTEINGGRMYVLSGGSSFNTVLNSGTQYVSGTDSDSEVNSERRNGNVCGFEKRRAEYSGWRNGCRHSDLRRTAIGVRNGGKFAFV